MSEYFQLLCVSNPVNGSMTSMKDVVLLFIKMTVHTVTLSNSNQISVGLIFHYVAEP